MWILERRCHHGLIGLALMIAGALTRGRAGAILAGGFAIAWDDRRDAPWTPIRREGEPA